MPDTAWGWIAWSLGAVACAAVWNYSSLWIVVQFLSRRALARHVRLAGGVNRIHVHGLNTAENCRTPMSIADAVIAFCVYDLRSGPLLLDLAIPQGRYWSVTVYRVDTTNVFSINDQQLATKLEGRPVERIRMLLAKSAATTVFAADSADITVLSGDRRGIVLIRSLVSDPENEVEAAAVAAQLATSRATLPSATL